MSSEKTWLFIGDSITDSNRTTSPLAPIGYGYVATIDSKLNSDSRTISIVNRGIAGNTVNDLSVRWNVDCLLIRPDLVSILIGVNDAAAKFAGAVDAYEKVYRDLLTALAKYSSARIVLVQPFLWPANPEQLRWVNDIAGKANTVERLAREFSATLVPAHAGLDSTRSIGASSLSDDGVHLNQRGNDALAQLWTDTVLA